MVWVFASYLGAWTLNVKADHSGPDYPTDPVEAIGNTQN